jgi:predicted permease
MDRLKGWLKQVRAALRPGRADREMREELQFHIEQETRLNLRRGMSEARARRTALVAFGAAERVKDDLRTAGLRGLAGELGRDLRHGLRGLRRRPSLAFAVIATLGLGLGVSTAMYSVVHAVVVRPLPYPESDRLVAVWETYPGWRGRPVLGDFWDRVGLAWPDFEAWRAHQRSFEAVAVFSRTWMTESNGDAAEVVNVARASSSFWDVAGIRPSIGRVFTSDGPGAPAQAVLSHRYWQRRFGADPAAIDSLLRLNQRLFTVAAVLDPDFNLSGEEGVPADIWIPAGSAGMPMGEDNHSFNGIGRLRRDVPLAAATEESAALLRGDRPATSRGASLLFYQDEVIGTSRQPLLLLLGATGLLLLIACVNVGALMAGDTARREHEVATRRALGATGGRLARQFTAEALALSLAAGVLGVATAAVLVPGLVALAPPDLPRAGEIAMQPGVFAFALLAALVTTLVCSTTSIAVARRRGYAAGPQASSRTIAAGRRGQPVFVGVQLVILTIMLTGAALLGRSLFAVRAIDPGFVASNLLTATIDVPPSRFEDRAGLVDYYRRVVEAVRAIPGIVAVSGVSTSPFAGGGESTSVGIEGLPEDAAKPEMQRRVVLPGYFEAMGIRVLSGSLDAAPGAPIVAVDEAMAARLWPGQSVIGKRISLRDNWYTVEAVAADVRDQALTASPQGTYYVTQPAAREDSRRMRLMVRTHADVDAAIVAEQVRAATRAVDPSIPMSAQATMESLMAQSVASERYRALLASTFAAASIILAAAGIFGVTLRVVQRRRREFGVRLALGARPGSLLARALLRTAAGAGIGLALGLALSVLLMPALAPYLHDLSTRDASTYAATAVLLFVVSLAASALPARGATRLNVVEVLREE